VDLAYFRASAPTLRQVTPCEPVIVAASGPGHFLAFYRKSDEFVRGIHRAIYSSRLCDNAQSPLSGITHPTRPRRLDAASAGAALIKFRTKKQQPRPKRFPSAETDM
jgi:hypothetical protein